MTNETEIGYEQRDNRPPGGLPVRADDAIAKGDLLAYYNPHLDIWHVKRVIQASRVDRRYGAVNQALKVVSHDAVPQEGTTGTASSHYNAGAGFRQVATRAIIGDDHGRDDSDPWYHVMPGPQGHEWIRHQDQLWAEYHADQAAETAARAGTPTAFEARMEARARAAEQLAAEATRLANAFTAMAEAIRAETRGRWIK